jgi:hypothetical protein
VAFQEVLLLGLASSGGVEVVMVAVLEFPHEEVAGIYLSVNSNFRVGHVNITNRVMI